MALNSNERVAALYRSDSPKIRAVVTRILGPRNSELVDDVLQDTFQKALTEWGAKGTPDTPSAWLMTCAKNRVIDVVRKQKTRTKFSADLSHHLESEWSLTHTVNVQFQEELIEDDQLRMIFMCCDTTLSEENRLTLILKTLCGLRRSAVAKALLVPEETVKKRISRTRQKLRDHTFSIPSGDRLVDSLGSAHTALYLLFNEGFNSTDPEHALNTELCKEAIRLVSLIARRPELSNQDTLALLALMHFHFARIATRTDEDGNLTSLQFQDRSRWDHDGIESASALLLVARDLPIGAGRFYIEANIALKHCKAESFARTDWQGISELYKVLIQIFDSMLTRLNYAVAVGYAGEPLKAIEIVDGLESKKPSFWLSATRAHLKAMVGDASAWQDYALAKSLGGSDRDHRVIKEQIEEALLKKHS